MIIPLSSVRCRLPMAVAGASSPLAATRPEARRAGAFSLVELLITMTLLSLIVLALMAVFSSTQTAFRASVTQTDILEGSRATMDLITTDLRTMTPSDGISNYNYLPYGAVNFFSSDNSAAKSLLYQPLLQSLPGTSLLRGNVLNYFFILGRNNQKWTGVGYVVNATNAAPLYPLYRFYAETNIASPPYGLFAAFLNTVNQGQWTNLSHVMDGVVHLAVRPYNLNGYWMTNTYQYYGGILTTNQNIFFLAPWQVTHEWSGGETTFYFYTNVVPASVELQLGVIEDRTLQRTESLGNSLSPGLTTAQSNYLAAQSGHVYLFHQRVAIPNVDPSAYQ
jgi:hypothetical protein